MQRTYSTALVAEKVGINRVTLQRWLRAGSVRPSVATPMAGRTLWRWTDRDVKRVRKYKQENYRKGRGRKPKPKPKPKR